MRWSIKEHVFVCLFFGAGIAGKTTWDLHNALWMWDAKTWFAMHEALWLHIKKYLFDLHEPLWLHTKDYLFDLQEPLWLYTKDSVLDFCNDVHMWSYVCLYRCCPCIERCVIHIMCFVSGEVFSRQFINTSCPSRCQFKLSFPPLLLPWISSFGFSTLQPLSSQGRAGICQSIPS